MKNVARLLATASLLALGTAAHAAFYVGAGAYSTSVDVAAGTIPDDSDVAPAIFAGFRPIELVGVEAGYYDLGSYSGIDASALTLAGLVSMEIGPVGVYAKGGLAQTTIDLGTLGDDESADPFGGIGASVDLMDKLYAYGEFLRFTHDDAGVDIDVLGVGLRYAF